MESALTTTFIKKGIKSWKFEKLSVTIPTLHLNLATRAYFLFSALTRHFSAEPPQFKNEIFIQFQNIASPNILTFFICIFFQVEVIGFVKATKIK